MVLPPALRSNSKMPGPDLYPWPVVTQNLKGVPVFQCSLATRLPSSLFYHLFSQGDKILHKLAYSFSNISLLVYINATECYPATLLNLLTCLSIFYVASLGFSVCSMSSV